MKKIFITICSVCVLAVCVSGQRVDSVAHYVADSISTNNITVPVVQSGITNVALIGVSSFTFNWKTAFPNNNYAISMTENGLSIPGLSITAQTTTNFSMSMTALTFTGNLVATGIQLTQ